MCFACETGGAQVGISPTLAARARRIEAAMPGRRVPEESWRVLLGQIGGSIPFADMRRLMECLDKAEQALCARLRCEAV